MENMSDFVQRLSKQTCVVKPTAQLSFVHKCKKCGDIELVTLTSFHQEVQPEDQEYINDMKPAICILGGSDILVGQEWEEHGGRQIT